MKKEILLDRLNLLYGDGCTFEWVSDGLQNVIIKCIHKSETTYLRLMQSNRRTPEMLEAELNWLSYLLEAGVKVPSPIKSHNNNEYEVLLNEEEVLYVSAFRKVEGEPLNVQNPNVWNLQLFHRWGETLGRIHATNPIGKVKRPFFTDSQTPFFEAIDDLMKHEDDTIKIQLQEIITELNELPHSSIGLIHNDFHQGNLLVHNGIIGVIDFDDCVYGWYAQDIAVTLYHAFWQATEIGDYDSIFGETFLNSFLEGYVLHHKITAEMIDQIPLFLQWRQFFLLALFLKNWPLHQLEDWQAYTLDKLKNRIITGDSYVPLTSKYLQELKQRFTTSQ